MKKAPGRNIKDQTATDYWLEKGDYINFDYVTVGWNVPVAKWKSMCNLSVSRSLSTIWLLSQATPVCHP